MRGGNLRTTKHTLFSLISIILKPAFSWTAPLQIPTLQQRLAKPAQNKLLQPRVEETPHFEVPSAQRADMQAERKHTSRILISGGIYSQPTYYQYVSSTSSLLSESLRCPSPRPGSSISLSLSGSEGMRIPSSSWGASSRPSANCSDIDPIWGLDDIQFANNCDSGNQLRCLKMLYSVRRDSGSSSSENPRRMLQC